MRLPSLLRRITRFIQRENLHRVLLITGAIVLASAVSVSWLEPNLSFSNALWWSIVTLTTVGYGDISPSTLGGRLIAIGIMVLGIGLLGMCSATLASAMVMKKIKEERGMGVYNFEDHLIVCEWNQRAQMILKELRADRHTAEAIIVLIADLDNKPVDDDNVFFIQGAVSDETLHRANLAQAETVVILSPGRLEGSAQDAQVVLNTLTVESLNPDVYTIVELADASHAQFCKRAHADEIIISSELSSGLISRAARNHGITKVVSELLSAHYGNELYKLPVPLAMVSHRFIDVMLDLKQHHHSIVVAVQHGDSGEVVSNPPADYQLAAHDALIVIAPERPRLG